MAGRLDIAGDARRAWEAMESGGIALIAGDVGYGLTATSAEAVGRIFTAKGRSPHKRNGLLGDYQIHRDLHLVDGRAREIIDTLVFDFDLPLGIVAPFRPGAPIMRGLDGQTLRGSTVEGTVNVTINQGALHEEIARLSREAGVAVLGSSANLTGTGIKGRLEDVEQPLRDIADVELDYGMRKYHAYRRASTLINFAELKVIRAGACYDIISDVLRRRFGLDVPPDPGFEQLPSGLFWEPASQA
jgi:tRNA A37 threonylcarbamoyladenosine synthetase subunit TsaC/SUA5/YrdC